MGEYRAPLVAIVGPTAVGKSRLALALAPAFSGEIVSADSRQVYRHMDIGTAKPSPEELALVPHHLIDIADPNTAFSLAQYQGLVYQAIRDIQQRHRLALLVGGSGLYVWSVLEGWQIPRVPPDLALRSGLEERASREGGETLYHELEQLDPVAAQRIDPANVRRIIRALEVCQGTHRTFPHRQRKKAPPFDILIIGLTMDRKDLYRRIDSRVDTMVESGLVKEVAGLLNREYDPGLPSMSGVGYKQITMFLKGELSLASATQQIKFETHRIARHQYTWFRLKDDRIRWFNIHDEVEPEISRLVAEFAGSK
ncbi:MAG: tRNA (adenosine(37)-N6)-dimethylallyltransferase MiaA [Chloroflexota bacterium]